MTRPSAATTAWASNRANTASGTVRASSDAPRADTRSAAWPSSNAHQPTQKPGASRSRAANASASRGHQDVGGFHGDDRGVAATHRGDPRLGREQGEEPGRDGFGTAHGQTVPGDTIFAGAVGTMTGP